MTHGVVVGMTGSGKTGLVTVMIEEAARAQVPTVVIDIKGDLPNLLLAFPGFEPAPHEPWVELESEVQREGLRPELLAARAQELCDKRRAALAKWQIGEPELAAYCAGTAVRVLTAGARMRESHSAVSLVLRLLGREPDPAKSREHVLLSVLAERRLLAGQSAELGAYWVMPPP